MVRKTGYPVLSAVVPFLLMLACCVVIATPAAAYADELAASESFHDTPLIALVDTGVDPACDVDARYSVIGDDGTDASGHGTAMFNAIRSINPNARVASIKALGDENRGTRIAVYAGVLKAIEIGADIVELSFATYAPEGDAIMEAVVSRAAARGIQVVAAAGNQGADASDYSPAQIDAVVTVGALRDGGDPLPTSNYGDCVNAWEVAMSTSQAAAIHAGRLSLGTERKPNGTARESYQIVFNANGGVGKMASLHVDRAFEMPPCVFSYEGKTAVGWTTSPDGKGRYIPERQYVDFDGYVYDRDGIRVEATLADAIDTNGVLTLYAQWEREPLATSKDYFAQWGWDGQNFTWLFQCKANSKYMTRAGTANGKNVSTAAFSKDKNRSTQQWAITTDRAYRIACANNTSYVLDVAGGSRADGTNVQVYKANDTAKPDSQRYWADPSRPGEWADVYNTCDPISLAPDILGANGNLVMIDVDTASSNVQIWQQDSSDRYPNSAAGTWLTSHGSKSKNRQWKAIRAAYTVKFNGNGSTSGSMSNQSHYIDVSEALTANAYKRAYKVTYKPNGGTCSTASATATATFNGWATTASGTKEYANKAKVENLSTCHGDTYNLYANWTLKTVKLPTPTRTGYTFAGWYTAATDGKSVGAAGATYKPTANITLYAHWKPIEYNVVYNANGATGGSTPQSKHQYNKAQNLNRCGYAKTGYTFKGWSTTAARANTKSIDYYDGASVINLANVNGATVNLYASWEPSVYQIQYREIDGATSGGRQYTTVAPSKATFDAAVTVPNPEKAGSRFDGWTITGMDGCAHVIGSQTTAVTSFGPTSVTAYKNLHSTGGTVTFTAKWKPQATIELYVDDAITPWKTMTIYDDADEWTWSVPPDVTDEARKPDCHHLDGTQGLEAWFVDSSYTEKVDAISVQAGGTYKLYARNWATVTHEHTGDCDIAVQYTNLLGQTGPIGSVSGTPADFEAAYATVVNLEDIANRRVTYDGNASFPSTLVGRAGWFARADGSGEALATMTVTHDQTIYKLWDKSIYDGYSAHN